MKKLSGLLLVLFALVFSSSYAADDELRQAIQECNQGKASSCGFAGARIHSMYASYLVLGVSPNNKDLAQIGAEAKKYYIKGCKKKDYASCEGLKKFQQTQRMYQRAGVSTKPRKR